MAKPRTKQRLALDRIRAAGYRQRALAARVAVCDLAHALDAFAKLPLITAEDEAPPNPYQRTGL